MWWKLYLLEYKRILRKPWLTVFLFSLYLIYALLIIYAINIISGLEIFTHSSLNISDYLKFPLAWATAAWLASYLAPLWLILAIIVLGDTNIFSRNLSVRKKVLTGKLGFIFTIPFDWTLTSLLAGYLLGSHWGHYPIHFFDYQTIGLFIQMLSYMIISLLLIALFRKASAAILAFFGYFIIEAVIRKILLALNILIAYYLPAKVMTSLVPPPAADFISGAVYNDFAAQIPLPFWLNVFLSVSYTIIFLIIALKIINSSKPNKL